MTDAPETLRQAQRWEHCKRRYLGVLDCHPCAAQAAWGTQCGFSVIHRPCDSCRAKVDILPVPAVNGWRKLRDERRRSELEASASGIPVVSDPEGPTRTSTATEEAA